MVTETVCSANSAPACRFGERTFPTTRAARRRWGQSRINPVTARQDGAARSRAMPPAVASRGMITGGRPSLPGRRSPSHWTQAFCVDIVPSTIGSATLARSFRTIVRLTGFDRSAEQLSPRRIRRRWTTSWLSGLPPARSFAAREGSGSCAFDPLDAGRGAERESSTTTTAERTAST